jgi:hypothetical protein
MRSTKARIDVVRQEDARIYSSIIFHCKFSMGANVLKIE